MNILVLENFKCFASESLGFGSLNMFAGANSTGKSTALQALLLLRQSHAAGYLQIGNLLLNGDLVSIGSARDLLFEGAPQDTIAIAGTADNHAQGAWLFRYTRSAEILQGAQTAAEVDDGFYGDRLFADRFDYISAERLGPRLFGSISENIVETKRSVGTRGEFAVHYLERFSDEHVTNHAVLQESAPSSRLLDQTQAWLDRISPGIQLTTTRQAAMDIVGLSYSLATPRGPSNSYRPTNIGFGLSYTLPVVVSLLSTTSNSCLIIENPEAHLHPRGQTAIGRLLARAAAGGAQIFFETHSDHVLNGVRLEIQAKRLAFDETRVFFTRRLSNNSESTIDSIMIDEHARLAKWPVGFFDEYEVSLTKLLDDADHNQ